MQRQLSVQLLHGDGHSPSLRSNFSANPSLNPSPNPNPSLNPNPSPLTRISTLTLALNPNLCQVARRRTERATRHAKEEEEQRLKAEAAYEVTGS